MGSQREFMKVRSKSLVFLTALLVDEVFTFILVSIFFILFTYFFVY